MIFLDSFLARLAAHILHLHSDGQIVAPTQDQLWLMQQLAEKLSRSQRQAQPRYLVYGEFRDTPEREFITEEDLNSPNGIRPRKD